MDRKNNEKNMDGWMDRKKKKNGEKNMDGWMDKK